MPELIAPFSLQRQNRECAAEIAAAVERVLASGRYIQGPECEALEGELAAFIAAVGPGPDPGGAAPPLKAIACASGTEALLLSLRALGVGPGDVVLTTPFSFFATAGAIVLVGAHPEFVDIDPLSFNLDPAALESALHRPHAGRLAAILPVHLFGRPAAMSPILALAAAAGVPVLEDAAQALGAGGIACGAAAAFSFYPTKNLGALGEGGLVTTRDPELEARLRLLRVHGSRRRYEHEIVGWNSRMQELQAAILRAKLPHLAAWNRRRRALASIYGEAFYDLPQVVCPDVIPGHIFHQYVIRAQDRDALRQFLLERHIGTEVYYPIPLHHQPALAAYKPADPLPEAERAAREVVALPMFPELTDAEAHRVATAIAEFYAR